MCMHAWGLNSTLLVMGIFECATTAAVQSYSTAEGSCLSLKPARGWMDY